MSAPVCVDAPPMDDRANASNECNEQLASELTRDAELRSLTSKPSSKFLKKKHKRVKLPEWYDEDLDARLVRKSGRLILAKIVNDPPPYWFVWIHNFKPQRDKASGAKTIGV